ncbi:MAG: YbaN family protein [Hyphomicrobium sp.]
MKPFWIMVGLLATAAGIAGVILPLVPTTPFLLLATFAFARSSPALHTWLVTHPTLGPPIANWNTYGAINRRSKITAMVLMAAAPALSVFLNAPIAAIGAQVVAMVGASAFILTRPNGPESDA